MTKDKTKEVRERIKETTPDRCRGTGSLEIAKIPCQGCVDCDWVAAKAARDPEFAKSLEKAVPREEQAGVASRLRRAINKMNSHKYVSLKTQEDIIAKVKQLETGKNYSCFLNLFDDEFELRRIKMLQDVEKHLNDIIMNARIEGFHPRDVKLVILDALDNQYRSHRQFANYDERNFDEKRKK